MRTVTSLMWRGALAAGLLILGSTVARAAYSAPDTWPNRP